MTTVLVVDDENHRWLADMEWPHPFAEGMVRFEAVGAIEEARARLSVRSYPAVLIDALIPIRGGSPSWELYPGVLLAEAIVLGQVRGPPVHRIAMWTVAAKAVRKELDSRDLGDVRCISKVETMTSVLQKLLGPEERAMP